MNEDVFKHRKPNKHGTFSECKKKESGVSKMEQEWIRMQTQIKTYLKKEKSDRITHDPSVMASLYNLYSSINTDPFGFQWAYRDVKVQGLHRDARFAVNGRPIPPLRYPIRIEMDHWPPGRFDDLITRFWMVPVKPMENETGSEKERHKIWHLMEGENFEWVAVLILEACHDNVDPLQRHDD